MKTLHSTLVLIKIANYVVRCTSHDVITLIFNINKYIIIILIIKSNTNSLFITYNLKINNLKH